MEYGDIAAKERLTGRAFFLPLDDESGWIDLGNIQLMSLGYGLKYKEHFTARRGLVFSDRYDAYAASPRWEITGDEFVSETLHLIFAGTDSADIVRAAHTNATVTATGRIGKWQILGITSVSAATLTTPAGKVEGLSADYVIDRSFGMFYLPASSTIPDGTSCTITYSNVQNVHNAISPFSILTREGWMLLFEEDDIAVNTTKRSFYFPVSLTTDSIGATKVDDFRTFKMLATMTDLRQCTIETRSNNPVIVPPATFTRYSGNPIVADGWGSPPITQVEEFMPFVNPLDPTQMIAIFSGVQASAAHIFYATSPANDGYTWTIGNSSAPIISDISRRADSIVINGTNIRLYSTNNVSDLTHGIDMLEQTFTSLAGLAGSWTLHSNVLLPTGSETEVMQGAVIKDGSTYYLYYSYHTAAASLPGIRVCTSSDGITWTRANGGADIISRGAAGTCDASFFEFHQIQKFGSQYIITSEVYGGPVDFHPDGSMWSEAMYYSASPTSGWAKNLSNPVFTGSGVAGTSDRYHVATPWWTFINGTWRLFYQASATDPFATSYLSAIWTVCESTLAAGFSPPDLITVPPVATAYSFSGPSSGLFGATSGIFTVALLPVGGTVVSPVVITPNAGSGGGTFTPTTVTLTTASPSATFTYTPASSGAKTIGVTNSGGLTNPGSLTYTVLAGLADGSPVSTWVDSSGNGHDATMTGSARPIFHKPPTTPFPVVRFTSAGASKLNLTTPISGAFPWIVFAVMIPATGTSRIDSLDGSDGGSPHGPFIVSGGAIYVFVREGYVQITAPVSFAWHVVEGIYGGVGSQFVLADGAGSTNTLTALANSGNFVSIGYDSVTPTYCDGDIAEILICNSTLSSTNRQNAEKTLSVKYGTPAPPAGSVIDLSTLPGLVGWWKADSLG